LAIGGSFIFFIFLVFIFFARIQSPGWEPIHLPWAFLFSTVSLTFSSIALFLSKRKFRAEAFKLSQFWLTVSLFLAGVFSLLQVLGFRHMIDNGIPWTKTSGAFMYIIIGIHFLHVLLGLVGLTWVWIDSKKSINYVDGFIHSLNPMKMTRFRLVSIYWHFLDFLWLFLFALLWMNQN